MMLEFQAFNKIPRLSRDMLITEKIDGTNAQVYIIKYKDLFATIEPEENIITAMKEMNEFIAKYCMYKVYSSDETDILYMFAGSRRRWLDCSSEGDNFGFGKWVKANAESLIQLEEGRHFGEWYGKGIQRGYGLDEKRFALFNVGKWASRNIPLLVKEARNYCPECCEVVPILYEGPFSTMMTERLIDRLSTQGSYAVKGFKKPEGIVIYHRASGRLFKKTIENDEKPKGK